MPIRQQQLTTWLNDQLDDFSIGRQLGDASFRRYFRIHTHHKTYIAMDAPPDKENCSQFVAVDATFEALGLPVPHIFAQDITQGFLLLEDFGDQQFYRILNPENMKAHYTQAMEELYVLQTCQQFSFTTPRRRTKNQGALRPEADENQLHHQKIMPFDRAQQNTELDYFSEWFLHQYLQLKLSYAQKITLDVSFDFLLTKINTQPMVCIHRDYHSKNLMLREDGTLGILDFQDAMLGGITYDLVSLLRDCYIDWPTEDVYALAKKFYRGLQVRGQLNETVSEDQFLFWFDLTGLQRHLKAIFIFARKQIRDQDSGYLQYIARPLNYARFVAAKYLELKDFHDLLENTIIPAWTAKQS